MYYPDWGGGNAEATLKHGSSKRPFLQQQTVLVHLSLHLLKEFYILTLQDILVV